MLRFPPLALAACAAAGLGLWLTRASLDVAPAGNGELRIAMFPSGVELGALIVLAAVVILLLARGARLLLRGTRRAALPADPLLPLLGLPLLAVPYLPWLPDAIPALRVLSGPARFGLWAIVLGQSLWIAWEVFQHRLRPRGEDAAVRPYARPSIIVLTIGAIAFGAAAAALTRGPVYPAGNEPHFLVVVQSLVQDGDLNVADDYAEREYTKFIGGALQPKVAAHDAASPLLPVGFPVLMAAPVAIGGYRTAAILLALGAAVLAAAAWRSAVQMTGSGESATAAWLGIAVSAPFVLHSCSFTPDLAAAAIVFTAVAWSPSAAHARGMALATQSVLIGLLPWLSPPYAPLAAALAVIVALRQHAPRGVALSLVPCFAVAAGAVLFHHQLWGSFLPTANGRAGSHGIAAALAGMWIDQEYGLLPYAPAAVLGFAGLASMRRHGGEPRRRAIESAAVIAVLATSLAALADWPGDAVRPGQQLVPALLLLVVPIAWWDRHAATFPLRRAAGRVLILAGVTISAALVTVNDGALIVNRSDGTSQLLEWLAPSRDLVRLVPSLVAQADAPWTVLSLVLLWLAAALIAVALSRRIHPAEPGLTAVAAVTLVVGAGACVAAAAPAVMDAHLARRIGPAARAESSMLTRFD
ncbi:MAG TPA: hypothetical protein VNK41_13050, partial [Vicinamibacterales bacterium]|nr:hypothetical protein [Vicinamibacterales bacterium]